jgi:sugar phosphate isomerase/epimerase
MKDYTNKLKDLLARGEKGSPKYEKLCAELSEKREARKPKFVEYTYETLNKIVPDAESRGLKLGIENRESLEEIPFETDLPFFFREFTSPSVVYWHDTGHAQIKDNLGFIHHTLHLESFRDRLAGFHIHDVQSPARDHCAPGTGTVDFAALKSSIKPEHIKVFEFGPGLTPEEVKSGITHVRGIWGEA